MNRLLRRSRRGRQRGVALLMVLSALTMLAVMLTEFQQETSAELASAMAERDSLQAEYAARSAISLTRLLIASEPTMRRALGPLLIMARMDKTQLPVWEHSDMVLGFFNDSESAKALGSLVGGSFDQVKGLGLGKGARFEVKIVDEDSKLNLNFAARGTVPARMVVTNQFKALTTGAQYDKLFQERDADGNYNERRSVCSAVVDWTDPDTEAEPCTPEVNAPSQGGSEDSYYEGLKPRYPRKNAAFDSLEEMHLVRGISEEFWSTFIERDVSDPSKRTVTVWGGEQVNVNTANAMTLMALVCPFVADMNPACIDPMTRSRVVSGLEMMRGFMPGIPLFKSPKGFVSFLAFDDPTDPAALLFGTLGIPPIKLISAGELIRRLKVRSDIFSIYATGIVRTGRRETRTRVHAVVDFRGAPPPGQPFGSTSAAVSGTQGINQMAAAAASAGVAPMGSASGAAGLAGPMGSAMGAMGLPPGTSPDAITAAMAASAGGHFIYYRIN